MFGGFGVGGGCGVEEMVLVERFVCREDVCVERVCVLWGFVC